MRDRTVEQMMLDALVEYDEADVIRRIENFVDAGVLTTDRGVVVLFKDGSEFQISIVRTSAASTSAEQEEDELVECEGCDREYEADDIGTDGLCDDCREDQLDETEEEKDDAHDAVARSWNDEEPKPEGGRS